MDNFREKIMKKLLTVKTVSWYYRKSNYYANHIQGAIRFHLDGSEAGIVTEGHQEKMEKRLEKTKVRKTTPPLENKNKDSDNSLSATIINDVK